MRVFEIIWNAFLMLCIFSFFFLSSFTAGYEMEKRELEREARCINSACEKACTASTRFKRHAGCTK